MIEVQIPRQYKYDISQLFNMIDTTLGAIYPKSISSNGVLTIDANVTPAQKQALKTNFLAIAATYQDLTA